MLRVYDGEQKGATAFFRNRPLLRTIFENLPKKAEPRYRVLFHSVSIGAEAYSFAIHCHLTGAHSERKWDLYATDLNPQFLHQAQQACYPVQVLGGLTSAEQVYFERVDEYQVRPIDDIRRMVHFLTPTSFVNATFDDSFDLVMILNSLTYVSEAEQAQAIANVSRYNTNLLVLSAFHPDTIERDLRAVGYSPITDNIEAIHNAWEEKIMPDQAIGRGTPEYSWALPPFARIPGYEYKYCALFRKGESLSPTEQC